VKKIISKKITALIILQAFLLCNNAWAGPTAFCQTANTDCLSPNIQMQSLILEKAFQQLVQDNTLPDKLPENQTAVRIDKEKLAAVLNKAFGKDVQPGSFTGRKFFGEETPIKIRFKWRWDPKTETTTKRTAVIIAEAVEVDYSLITLYHRIERARFSDKYPRVMEMLVYFDKDGVEVSHIEVNSAIRKRGIGTIAFQQLKILADEFSNGKVRIVHSVNRTTLDILQKIAVEKGQGIDEVKEHMLRYPQIYKAGKINKEGMSKVIGRDIVLSRDPEQEERRERFITSLVNVLEAVEEHGIKIMEQKEINKSPLVKIFQKSDYKNIKIEFGYYAQEYVEESTGKILHEQMRDIQISALSHEENSNNNNNAQLSKDKNNFKIFMAKKIEEKGGRVSFADFMQEALYSEYGYYKKDIAIGRDKDFDTYAEHMPFAYALAKQLIQMWQIMGKPNKFSVVEMGAGNGVLSKNIIRYIQQNEAMLYKSLDYVIVDISPKLKNDQRETFIKEFGSLENVPVRWVEGNALDLSKLKGIEGVFISNELPDSFPVHRIKKVAGRIQEVYTVFRDGEFQDELGHLSTPELKEYVDNLKVALQEGQEAPVNLNLRIWQENMAKALKKGFVITIDYGGKIEEISNFPYAVWNRQTNDIEVREEKIKYLYDNSGSCDITANVNFYDMAKWGEAVGLNLYGYSLQRDFLWNLGFNDIIDNLLMQGIEVRNSKSLPHEIGTNFHFKVLVQSKNIDTKVSLEGLKNLDRFYVPYGQITHLVLPITPEQSSFLVCTNDRFNITAKTIKEGKEAVKTYKQNFGYYGMEYLNIIEPDERYVQDGRYVLPLLREEIEDMRIYNDKGEILFDSRDAFKDSARKKALSLDYKEYEKKYLSYLDLGRMDIEKIPSVFYLHKNGSIMLFPQYPKPLDVISNELNKKENILSIQNSI